MRPQRYRMVISNYYVLTTGHQTHIELHWQGAFDQANFMIATRTGLPQYYR